MARATRTTARTQLGMLAPESSASKQIPRKSSSCLGSKIGVESNNYAEYRAIEIALEEVKRRYEVDESFDIEVVSDSKLAVNTLGGDWKTNKSHLREIIARIQEIEEELGVSIQYSWVKAHIGVHYNELADYLAYNAARGD